VEQDEEIATIETDKIDVSVNAPEAGTIKEFLVNEEDTVTVGQDLVKLELGGEPSGGSKQDASSETKEAASKDQDTASQPSGEQEQSKPHEESKPREEEKPAPPKQESKPEPPKPEQKPQPPKQESKPAPPKEEPKQTQPGSREERRVRAVVLSTIHSYR
jgi:2-oxoglutarate dehydrogenase E2 component (dihydrolipoamide succinyltransferase)